MEYTTAEILTQKSGLGEIYEDYSGRGMFGRKTTGIVFENDNDFFEAIAEIMVSGEEEEREEVAEYLTEIKKDSMGLNVIYY